MSRLLPFLTTQALRPISRFFPDMLWRINGDSQEKMAYLTFDDGPTPEMTQDLLALLRQYNAKGTCFLIGAHVQDYPTLTNEIIEDGHVVGNHTFSHPDAWIHPPRELRKELYLTSELLEQYTGEPIQLMRPPYGHFTSEMRFWCRANGNRMSMWDVMPGDYLPTATADSVARHIRRTIRPGSIIVLHDNPVAYDITLPALNQLLPDLISEGWRFDALPTTASDRIV